MIEILLIAIILFEAIRMAMYLIEIRRSKILNQSYYEQRERALEFEKQQSEDWKRIRALEIEELKQGKYPLTYSMRLE